MRKWESKPGRLRAPKFTSEPMSAISKSAVQAMGCERFFAAHYLDREPVLRLLDRAQTHTGTAFHEYRRAYIDHLVQTRQESDAAWVKRWLEESAVDPDARDLILRDADQFRIDPEAVLGTEVFLSVDRDFQPVEKVIGTPPEWDKRAYLHGFIDLLLLDGDVATIVDAKTGWWAGADEDEAALYAIMVFAHFPAVERVEFRWDYLRHGQSENRSYSRRDDLGWMQARARAWGVRRDEIAARRAAGKELQVNTTAGLCGICQLACPVKTAVTNGVLDIAPLQTEDDARKLGQRVYVAGLWSKHARAALSAYLREHGPLDLGGGYVAKVSTEAVASYPLEPTLRVLGLLPEDALLGNPLWDIPLEKLTIGGLGNLARATKKRPGLKDALEPISEVSYRNELRIQRDGDALLEYSQ